MMAPPLGPYRWLEWMHIGTSHIGQLWTRLCPDLYPTCVSIAFLLSFRPISILLASTFKLELFHLLQKLVRKDWLLYRNFLIRFVSFVVNFQTNFVEVDDMRIRHETPFTQPCSLMHDKGAQCFILTFDTRDASSQIVLCEPFVK